MQTQPSLMNAVSSFSHDVRHALQQSSPRHMCFHWSEMRCVDFKKHFVVLLTAFLFKQMIVLYWVHYFTWSEFQVITEHYVAITMSMQMYRSMQICSIWKHDFWHHPHVNCGKKRTTNNYTSVYAANKKKITACVKLELSQLYFIVCLRVHACTLTTSLKWAMLMLTEI